MCSAGVHYFPHVLHISFHLIFKCYMQIQTYRHAATHITKKLIQIEVVM
jgi:hypothetical protein